MARFHDIDEDVAGIQVSHQARLVRLTAGPDGFTDGSVRPTGEVVEFVEEAQKSQHRTSFYDGAFHPSLPSG
ncbi:hypothetical protein ACWD0A_31290 [Streptomyces sp. NPDC002867]